MARIVVASYLVRNPLGGYAWQAAHYLLGLRALGHDAWLYEDTGHYAMAYDPSTNAFEPEYGYGLRAARAFLDRLGLGDRWVFVDCARNEEHGPGAGKAAELLREADLLINVAGVNRVPPDRRGGRPAVYVDIDPGVTQIRAAEGDTLLRAILDEHVAFFTVGENIGTPRSSLPTGGYTWQPTRSPVAVDLWQGDDTPGGAYTTIGTWNTTDRDLTWGGQVYTWRKRLEWMQFLALPGRTGCSYEIAMNVDAVPGDLAILSQHGWSVRDPREVSADPWGYREFIRASRGEFTVAKDLNVRLRSGWFSDRAACYLAAGRPVVEQDTAFGDVLPLGPGLHAFRTLDEAVAATAVIESDYAAARAHARDVAREYLAGDRVLGAMLHAIGL